MSSFEEEEEEDEEENLPDAFSDFSGEDSNSDLEQPAASLYSFSTSDIVMESSKEPIYIIKGIASYTINSLSDVKALLQLLKTNEQKTKIDKLELVVYLGPQWLITTDVKTINFFVSTLGALIPWFNPSELILRMKSCEKERDGGYNSSEFGKSFFITYNNVSKIIRGDLSKITISLNKYFCECDFDLFRRFIESNKIKELILVQEKDDVFNSKESSMVGCILNTRSLRFSSYRSITRLTIQSASLDATSCIHLRDFLANGYIEDFCLNGCRLKYRAKSAETKKVYWRDLFTKGIAKSKTLKRLRLVNMTPQHTSPIFQYNEIEGFLNQLSLLFRYNTTIEYLSLAGFNIPFEDHQWLKLFTSLTS